MPQAWIAKERVRPGFGRTAPGARAGQRTPPPQARRHPRLLPPMRLLDLVHDVEVSNVAQVLFTVQPLSFMSPAIVNAEPETANACRYPKHDSESCKPFHAASTA